MLTFVISSNSFLLKFLEEFAKKLEVKLYTMDKIEESLFFIHDLSTALLIVDSKDLNKMPPDLQSIWAADQKLLEIPTFILGDSQNISLRLNIEETIPKPIDPLILIQKIQARF